MGTSVGFSAAADILAQRDPVIARLAAEAGPPRLHRFPGTPFAVLVRAIVYQQLAGAAAAAIHGRLVAALGDDVEPAGLAALSDETLGPSACRATRCCRYGTWPARCSTAPSC